MIIMEIEKIEIETQERIYLQILLESDKRQLEKLLQRENNTKEYKEEIEKRIEYIKGINKKLLNR